jgi:hypothetical protein
MTTCEWCGATTATCAKCGRTFGYLLVTKRRRFCEDCRPVRLRTAPPTRLPAGREITTTCRDCGREFTFAVRRRHRILCDECRTGKP